MKAIRKDAMKERHAVDNCTDRRTFVSYNKVAAEGAEGAEGGKEVAAEGDGDKVLAADGEKVVVDSCILVSLGW